MPTYFIQVYIREHLHVHNSILLLSLFLRLSFLSLFPVSFPNASVLYIHIFSMYICNRYTCGQSLRNVMLSIVVTEFRVHPLFSLHVLYIHAYTHVHVHVHVRGSSVDRAQV